MLLGAQHQILIACSQARPERFWEIARIRNPDRTQSVRNVAGPSSTDEAADRS